MTLRDEFIELIDKYEKGGKLSDSALANWCLKHKTELIVLLHHNAEA